MDIDKIMWEFQVFAREKREEYGEMKDVAPLLWDINLWLHERLIVEQIQPPKA